MGNHLIWVAIPGSNRIKGFRQAGPIPYNRRVLRVGAGFWGFAARIRNRGSGDELSWRMR
jgi:hypothetical protein